ncbi:GNAT family N-acetyltransferase [Saccharopolyspora sp. K220]|uniref:GNAT family N-acetyltransferase n=1 Tax=Saccharopolyspora soli TaxID=2926618 RepID=UPI001F57A10E|nr:GNAT family N-acetyltransferase [Saccharopolyspora soli]MCI2423572.1 GNAT family N-acetyltransferase [Saccharopolyspora soli]
MTARSSTEVRQWVSGATVPDDFRRALTDCWVAVTNAGGAAGFPFPPVSVREVRPAVDNLVAELHPDQCRLLTAQDARGLLGWLVLRRNPNPLIAHWASVHHVQSHPNYRGEGVGTSLMAMACQVAKEELGLEHLHLAVRGGMDLESFYARLGWQEVGRWPKALRLAPNDDRDEVLMHLQLS